MKYYSILFILGSFLLGCTNISTNVVSLKDKQLWVNNRPHFIKGVCYHPVAVGKENIRSFQKLEIDIALLQEANINTIRVYAPIAERKVLDALASANIKVIMGFGYDQGGVYDILSGSYLEYVKQYKNHPAILFWELGNEYNYHPEWFQGGLPTWYKALEDAAQAIKEEDKNHPVATAHGEIPNKEVLQKLPSIDIWGMNVYRWDRPATIFEEWEQRSNKPMYFAEAGADSYMTVAAEGYVQGENQQAQADANAKILDAILKYPKRSLGVAIFSFTDGWWKAGNPAVQDIGGTAPNSSGVPYDGSPNEEYWGMVDIHRNKKKTYTVIQNRYANN
ncbi:MAG: hypothetical protein OIF50_01075 [Flavobacteriaceae bacterium]|nr:hypothetical protein [Flavobacteriaceae bacterium]